MENSKRRNDEGDILKIGYLLLISTLEFAHFFSDKKTMKKVVLIICILSFSFLSKVYCLCLPAYPFEFSYVIYSGEKTGDVNNLLHINAGIRLEGLKAMYFDIFFQGDLLLHMSKEQGLYADMLQKDLSEFFNTSVNFPSMAGFPISLSLFFGKYDELGSDSILREHVKSHAYPPTFMKSYPANIFRPNLEIAGAGLALYGALSSGFYSGFYTHWNTKTDESLVYTNDLRFGFTYSTFSFESFVGFLAKTKLDDFRMRIGVMGSINIEEYELFFEMGFAQLAPHHLSWDEINSQFYVLFEPRIKRQFFNLVASFFMSSPFQLPNDLENESFKNKNFLGFNLLTGFGNLEEHKINTGISLLTAVNLLNITEVTPFTFSIAPFITVAVGEEVEFSVRTPFNPLLYKDFRHALMAEFSVKAVY